MKKFTHFESITYLGFFAFFENPDMVDVQIAINMQKQTKIKNFKKNQKYDPRASI